VVLFSGWKAGALLSMAAYVMAMLAALANMGRPDGGAAAAGADPQQQQQQPAGGGGGDTAMAPAPGGGRSSSGGSGGGGGDDERAQLGRVLLYVPVAFVAAPLELLLALQAANSPFSAASSRLSEPQLAAFVGFVVACLCDERVVHPGAPGLQQSRGCWAWQCGRSPRGRLGRSAR
jgi:hypothetical protein